MGHGEFDELTPSEADLAASEEATRRLLARWGEPAPAPPPPALSARVIAALSGSPTRRRPTSLARIPALALALLAPLLALGLWGVFGDSAGPAALPGGPDGALGRLALALTLAAKPLVNLVLGAGAAGLLALAALLLTAWLWWRLARSASAQTEAAL